MRYALRSRCAVRTSVTRIRTRPRRGRRADRHRGGTAEVVECDTVVFTGDWMPDHELARLGGLTIDHGTAAPSVDQRGCALPFAACSRPATCSTGPRRPTCARSMAAGWRPALVDGWRPTPNGRSPRSCCSPSHHCAGRRRTRSRRANTICHGAGSSSAAAPSFAGPASRFVRAVPCCRRVEPTWFRPAPSRCATNGYRGVDPSGGPVTIAVGT